MIVVLARDLIIYSRIVEAAAGAATAVMRVEHPSQLPAARDVRLLLVDWGERDEGWANTLERWLGGAAAAHPKVVLFGPHTDLRAHAEARAAGLGPMMARSRLMAALPGWVA